MRVVYWGRWADSSGNVGPFSATAAGWIEGGSHRLLPGGLGMQIAEFGKPVQKELEAVDKVLESAEAATKSLERFNRSEARRRPAKAQKAQRVRKLRRVA